MYNPFKPHIRLFSNGQFGIAKLTMIGFAFYDLKDNHWWHLESTIRDYCLVNDPKLLRFPPPKPTHKYYDSSIT